jgi:hypothetical protein
MGQGVNCYALQIKHKTLLCHRFCVEEASDLIPMTEHHAMEEYKGPRSKITSVLELYIERR